VLSYTIFDLRDFLITISLTRCVTENVALALLAYAISTVARAPAWLVFWIDAVFLIQNIASAVVAVIATLFELVEVIGVHIARKACNRKRAGE
jgi:hypothetical protein